MTLRMILSEPSWSQI